MTDDLKDIEPEIVDAVTANADAFIEADKRIDEIIAWGESELKSREEHLKATNGTLQDFKNASSEVESLVAKKLKAFELEIQARYSSIAQS